MAEVLGSVSELRPVRLPKVQFSDRTRWHRVDWGNENTMQNSIFLHATNIDQPMAELHLMWVTQIVAQLIEE